MEQQNFIFEEYDKILNLNNQQCQKNLKKWQQKQFSIEAQIQDEKEKKCQWAISEKIHGCNLSFIVNDNLEIKCGKRTSLLQNDEKFYNFQDILEKIEKKLINLYKLVKQKIPETSQIQVYGELYGGKYSQKTLKIEGQQQENINNFGIKVQHEVQYCPQNDFSAFDLKIFKKQQLKGEYLKFQESLELFEISQINYIKPLKIGKFEDLEPFDVETFQSQIYKQYNLHEIPENIAEGIVLRPYNRGHSPLIKKKSQIFQEKTLIPKTERKKESKLDKLQQLQEKIEKSEKNTKISKLVKQKHQEFCDEALLYICENRLKNMLSKTTEEQAFSSLHAFYLDFIKDAIEDFINDGENDERSIWYKNLQGEKKCNVEDMLISEAKAVVKEFRGPLPKKDKKKNKKK